jgi:hypothetical protein
MANMNMISTLRPTRIRNAVLAGEPGEDQIPVSALDLDRVDVDHEREDRNDVPLEERGVAKDR